MQENKFFQSDFIEAYLIGEISTADRQAMDMLLYSDLKLQAEVGFQKDLISVISESRKQTLKKMLQDTPVPAYTGFQIQNWVWGVMAALLVGVIGFFILADRASILQKNTVVVQPKALAKKENKNVLPKEEQTIASENKEEKAIIQPKKQEKIAESADNKSPFVQEIYYSYDGKEVLQLFGDIAYEVLEEVDLGGGKKTFLYSQNKFFELLPTQGDEMRNLKDSQVKKTEIIKLLQERLDQK